MRRFPGGIFYEPADLGVNALAVAANTTVSGNILPLAAAFRAHSYLCIIDGAGPSVNVQPRFNIVDIDGQTIFGAPDDLIIATGFDPSLASAGHILVAEPTDNAVSSASSANITGHANAPLLLGAPYFRPRILNADAVNAATITLRIWLFE